MADTTIQTMKMCVFEGMSLRALRHHAHHRAIELDSDFDEVRLSERVDPEWSVNPIANLVRDVTIERVRRMVSVSGAAAPGQEGTSPRD